MFPCSFFLGVVRPLNLEKLDAFVAGVTFRLIKYTNRILLIGEIFTEINCPMFNSTDEIFEAFLELGYMEGIMYL